MIYYDRPNFIPVITKLSKVLDEISLAKEDAYSISGEYHNITVHRHGFCQTCGELRKRCECFEFNDHYQECNCEFK